MFKALCRAMFLACVVALVGGCGKPAGAPCTITGSGFTASHDCASKCLARWNIYCPDGSRVTPGVCAGRETCTVASCPDGQLCYYFDDPFEERSFCIPDDVCGAPPKRDDRLRWEKDSSARAAALRAEYDARRAGRSGAVTAPVAEPPQPEE